MEKARILLVDENELFRRGIRHRLEQEADMEIVGDCTSAEEALSQVETLSPNIVLMDAWLPGMNGIEACHRLTGNGHACDVIILTTGQRLINKALVAGVAGYFPKELRHEELVTAIRLTHKWQALKAELEANIYPTAQAEAMAMENLTQFTAEETHDEDEPEWLPPEGNGSAPLQEVTLVISSPGDAAQLQKFICQVEETFGASILETVGSWSDTHLTLKLQSPVPLANILDELVKMPEVEEAGEKTPKRRSPFSFSKEIEAMPRKRLWVTLSGQAQPLTIAG